MLPYRRHHNGGGKLYDEAFVSRDSFIDRDSLIVGEKSNVTASRLWRTVISNCVVHGAAMSDVLLRGGIGGGVVDGGVRLMGPWELSGPFYIRSGIWNRPPRNKVLIHECGISVGVTESSKSRAFIGCNERPIADWIKCGLRIGKWLHWPDELAREAYYFMQELADVPMEIAA